VRGLSSAAFGLVFTVAVSAPVLAQTTAGTVPVTDVTGTVPNPPPQPDFIPPVTDEDRKAAFPDVDGHATHDNGINYFVLFDQLEWETGTEQAAFGWDTKAWVGRDRDRAWFRTEGQRSDGDVWDAQTHALYGRQIARWWDVLAGVRQDFAPGPVQTWAAFGIQGLAPYWFNVEATAYVGAEGRNHYRLETEYEFLLTNRLVLQPQAEMEIYGKPDLEHDRDKGLATLDFGFRLRYLIRRELAPYVGVVWHQKHFGTADIARANGDSTGGARFVTGLRFWM
jgi:copper resistance protein B